MLLNLRHVIVLGRYWSSSELCKFINFNKLPKKDENIFSQYGPNNSNKRLYFPHSVTLHYIDFPACCFLVGVKLVYVQGVQEIKNSNMTV